MHEKSAKSRILDDFLPEKFKIPELYVIFAREINKISEFCMIVSRKIFSPDFFG